MKKQKDVKFIIYQALYILVICIIALKGANLDLTQVIEDDGKLKVTMTQIEIDSILKLLEISIIVDTNRFAIVDKNLLVDNEKMKELVRQTMISSASFTSDNPIVEKQVIPDKPVEVDPDKPKKSIVLGKLELFQFHQNTVNNQNDYPITIAGVTIAAHSTGRVMLGGESVVTITGGDQNITANVKPNEKPKINMQRVASMGEDTRVTQLQSSVCFRVTISDDFPGQLDVKFNGPVTVKTVGTGVYDVTMNAFGSRSAFDNFTDNKDAPYSVGFTVSVSDNIAGHKITGQNSFSFGEW